jgi:hypothetical protein
VSFLAVRLDEDLCGERGLAAIAQQVDGTVEVDVRLERELERQPVVVPGSAQLVDAPAEYALRLRFDLSYCFFYFNRSHVTSP